MFEKLYYFKKGSLERSVWLKVTRQIRRNPHELQIWTHCWKALNLLKEKTRGYGLVRNGPIKIDYLVTCIIFPLSLRLVKEKVHKNNKYSLFQTWKDWNLLVYCFFQGVIIWHLTFSYCYVIYRHVFICKVTFRNRLSMVSFKQKKSVSYLCWKKIDHCFGLSQGSAPDPKFHLGYLNHSRWKQKLWKQNSLRKCHYFNLFFKKTQVGTDISQAVFKRKLSSISILALNSRPAVKIDYYRKVHCKVSNHLQAHPSAN